MNRKLQRMMMMTHGLDPIAQSLVLSAERDGDSAEGAGGGEPDRGDAGPAAQEGGAGEEQPEGGDTPGEQAFEEEDAGEGEEDKGEEPMIPKPRFDEAVRRERERRIQAEEQLQRIAQTGDDEQHQDNLQQLSSQLEAKEDEYEDAVFQGEKEKARAIRQEIRDLRQQERELHSAQSSDEARERALQQVKYDQELSRIEGTYTALNPDSEAFDSTTANEVAEVMKGLQTNGRSPAEALRRAARYVLGTPEDAGPAEDPEAQRSRRQERAQEGRRRTTKAAGQQPADASKAGASNQRTGKDAQDVSQMSEKEFAELSEQEKARMRGDIVE